MYLGAKAMEGVIGTSLWQGVMILAAFSALYSLYGGLMAVAWTDIVQVVVLVIGGIVTTWFALDYVGGGNGPIEGFSTLIDRAPEKFEMLFEPDDTFKEADGEVKSAYQLLPWFGVLFGGMWIANLFYWGFNQYITQRALAAKNLAEAQKGMLFAGYLKLLMPIIVAVPGIAAFVLLNDFSIAEIADLTGTPVDQISEISASDGAYPWLLKVVVPTGIKGLAFAALAAAIVSSLSSMINSISTIFTMDLYKKRFNPQASEKTLVRTGRIVALIALIIAIPLAPLLNTLDQVFQFIQEFTGLVSPGILVIFLMGMFVKFVNTRSAIWAAVLTLPIGIALRLMSEGFGGEMVNGEMVYTITPLLSDPLPFLDRMGITFLVLAALMLLISYIDTKGASDEKAISLRKSLFKTSNSFNIGAIGIAGILTVIYILLANPPG